jgi:hypothetical protein
VVLTDARPMRQIVEDVLGLVRTGKVGPILRAVTPLMTELELRLICINLLAWWGNSTLMQSAHPVMSLPPEYPWCQKFRTLVEAVPELAELLEVDDQASHFSASVTADEREQITRYIHDHYRPPLMPRTWTA